MIFHSDTKARWLTHTGNKSNGFTLIEILFYIVLFTVLFAVISQTLLTISGTHDEISAIKNINNSASLALERMTRDIRDAHHVIVSESQLATSSGSLTLALTSDELETTTFRHTADGIELLKNDTVIGSLVGPSVTINELSFFHITSTTSEAVRITMNTHATTSNSIKQHTFHTTAILRESY